MQIKGRRKARVAAFQILFSREKLGVIEEGERMIYESAKLSQSHLQFSKELVEKVWGQLGQIDAVVQKHLKKWKQNRINDGLNAILRMSCAELLYFQETDAKVIFNEAIEICKEFVGKEATGFLNGVLHAVGQSIEVQGQTPVDPKQDSVKKDHQ